MSVKTIDYSLFTRFIETYSPTGFTNIDPKARLLVELEQMMEENDQFFYIADIMKIKILYTSLRSRQMIGIDSTDLDLNHFMEITHPDDIQRLSLGRTKVIKMAQELFINEKGSTYFSTNFRMRTPGGSYSNFLIQCINQYVTSPFKTVWFFKLHTNIDKFPKIKHGYHYNISDKLDYFRYPDIEMLQTGNVFTKREFEIIRLIESGHNTEQIAKKLFLSPYTINTHRGNILQKSSKSNISELIFDLKERGIL